MDNIKIAEIYFHIKTTEVSIGEEKWDSSGAKAINIVATGTATNFEASFEGKVGSVWDKTMGVRVNNLLTCDKMDTKEVVYQVDLTGFKGFRCNLTNISGGDITIYGYAVK